MREKTKQLAQQLHQFVNSGENIDHLIELMDQDHPTLQQRYTEISLAWIRNCSEKKYFDARNEASIIISQEIVAAVDFPKRLPYI